MFSARLKTFKSRILRKVWPIHNFKDGLPSLIAKWRGSDKTVLGFEGLIIILHRREMQGVFGQKCFMHHPVWPHKGKARREHGNINMLALSCAGLNNQSRRHSLRCCVSRDFITDEHIDKFKGFVFTLGPCYT